MSSSALLIITVGISLFLWMPTLFLLASSVGLAKRGYGEMQVGIGIVIAFIAFLIMVTMGSYVGSIFADLAVGRFKPDQTFYVAAGISWASFWAAFVIRRGRHARRVTSKQDKRRRRNSHFKSTNKEYYDHMHQR